MLLWCFGWLRFRVSWTMLRPHADVFAQEVLLGCNAMVPPKLPHFALPGCVHRHKKALFRKVNGLIRLH